MLFERLRLALASGAAVLPAEGRIAVMNPAPDEDLSLLPRDRVEVISRHYAPHHAFRDAGYATALAPGGPYGSAIFCLPRARAEAEASLVALHAVTTGPLIVDGQKTDGIDSMLKALRARATVGDVTAKAHGKCAAVSGVDLSDWLPGPPIRIAERFVTAPGVFSAGGIDPGSEALAKALPPALNGHVVDLGAGWGYLADAILAREGVTVLDLVESDHAALDAARANIADPRARFHWADALSFRPETPVDHVVTNPPFHQGRAADPGLGQSFIRAAAAILAPRGRLWLVANRHLPYENTLKDAFREVRTLGETPSFKLYAAAAPARARRKG